MDPEQGRQNPTEQPFPPAVPQFPQINWLHGPNGLRSGWRLLVYFLMVIAMSAAAAIAARVLFKPTGVATPQALLVQELVSFTVAFGAAYFMSSQIERRPLGDYGLPLGGLFGTNFWWGFLFGIVEVCALMGLISAFGGYSFGDVALQGGQIFRWGAFHLLLFFFVGLFEEFLFRGYTQFTLGDGIGFWPAAILLSLGFGAVHLTII